jgi:nucleotide-binding universal stress UspA family protein
MKILVGVDESAYSQAAVDYVRRMSWPPGTTVRLVAVARTPVILSTEMYAPGLSYDDQVMKAEVDFRRTLVDAAEKTFAGSGIPVSSEVVTGDPRLELVEVARREKADLLVVGSHGRSGLARLLLGSVAAHVVTHSPCSVIVVKSGDRTG